LSRSIWRVGGWCWLSATTLALLHHQHVNYAWFSVFIPNKLGTTIPSAVWVGV